MLRQHAARIRNTTFAATEELMVCDSSPSLGFLKIHIRSQASGDYDPSFVTEVLLREISYSDTRTKTIIC